MGWSSAGTESGMSVPIHVADAGSLIADSASTTGLRRRRQSGRIVEREVDEMPVEVPKRLGPVPQRLGPDLLKQAIRSRAILQHQLRELDTSPPAAARSSNDEVRGISALGDRRVAIRASLL